MAINLKVLTIKGHKEISDPQSIFTHLLWYAIYGHSTICRMFPDIALMHETHRISCKVLLLARLRKKVLFSGLFPLAPFDVSLED